MTFNNDSRVRRGVKEEEDEGENGDEDAEPHEEEQPLPLTDQPRKQKDENAENDQTRSILLCPFMASALPFAKFLSPFPYVKVAS
jgi:hypothetical protein